MRETEEKIKRAREAKERAQKEKAAKIARKKAIVDMTIGRVFFFKGCLKGSSLRAVSKT